MNMSKSIFKPLLACLVLSLFHGNAIAAEGTSLEALEPPFQGGQGGSLQAVKLLNQGIRFRDKAVAETQKADAASSDKARSSAEKKARSQFDKAIAKYRQSVKLDQTNARTFQELGFAYQQIGDHRMAIGAFNYALRLEPKLYKVMAYRAESCLALGLLDETKKAYTELAEKDPDRAKRLAGSIDGWLEGRESLSEQEQAFASWYERAKT